MIIKQINVGKVEGINVQIPESIREMRLLVADELDLIYIANRGFDQVRRTCLLSRLRRGATDQEIRDMAEVYHYHRLTRFPGH